ncbi:MAG TPA: hypothetical protein VMV29_00720 [Ktedonobacterales bacterium]|nr:hypothetical protein [Ktedonobacterales bacterium]
MSLHDDLSLGEDSAHSPSTCPIDQLDWLVNHSLSAEEQALVAAHVATCAACQARVAALTGLRQAMWAVSAQTPDVRADLFAQIERRLDAAASPVARLRPLLQACWLAAAIVGEHLWAQTRLIRRDLFWAPLLILPLVGAVVFLPPPWAQAPGTAALLAAFLSALGMAFLYGPQVDPAREIALVTPTSPRLVLGVRCCVVFGYDLALNCGLVLPFLVVRGVVTPGWFLANWLAPLCALSGIALLLSILLSANVAVLVCVILWALRLFGGAQAFLLASAQPLPAAPWQQVYERFWSQGPLLLVVAVLAALLAFVALERKERFAR